MIKSTIQRTEKFRKITLMRFFSASFIIALGACGGGSTGPTIATPTPTSSTPTPANPTPTNTICAKTHPRVGQIAILKTFAHKVAGQAKVIDNCTIEITNFSYDGGGLPDVFLYGGKAGTYNSGLPIGENLFGRIFTNATMTFKFKEGDLDKIDGVSIWCVRAAVSFGDGLFVSQ